MCNKKLFINIVYILFCFCIIGCKFKQTQIAEIEKNDAGKTEKIESHSENNEFKDYETDNFGGEYIFSSVEILEYQNIDLEKYTELNETMYIKMIKISNGKYNVETNCWLLEECRLGGREGVIEYPQKYDWNKFNFNERFDNRFYQSAADGPYSGIYIDFYYTGIGIVLNYIEWDHDNEKGYDKERIECYIYFNKKNENGYNGIVNDNAVRIRDKPSIEGTVVGQFNKGTSVTVFGRSQERIFLEGYNSYWLKVRKDNTDGWVYGAYIDLIDTQYDLLPEIR
jgi:hypothetical protein